MLYPLGPRHNLLAHRSDLCFQADSHLKTLALPLPLLSFSQTPEQIAIFPGDPPNPPPPPMPPPMAEDLFLDRRRTSSDTGDIFFRHVSSFSLWSDAVKLR